AGVPATGRVGPGRSARTGLVDAAHSPHGMTATVAAVTEAFGFRRLVGVVAVLADKDARGMLAVLEPVLDEIVVTQNSSSRRLPADELAAPAGEGFRAGPGTRRGPAGDGHESAVPPARGGRDPAGGGGRGGGGGLGRAAPGPGHPRGRGRHLVGRRMTSPRAGASPRPPRGRV